MKTPLSTEDLHLELGLTECHEAGSSHDACQRLLARMEFSEDTPSSGKDGVSGRETSRV